MSTIVIIERLMEDIAQLKNRIKDLEKKNISLRQQLEYQATRIVVLESQSIK